MRFEPLLYVPAFTQNDFHYLVHTGLPTQGTSTEDLGKYNWEYTTPLSTEYNLSQRLGTKPHKHHLIQEG